MLLDGTSTDSTGWRGPDRTSRDGSRCGRWIVEDAGDRVLASPTTSTASGRDLTAVVGTLDRPPHVTAHS